MSKPEDNEPIIEAQLTADTTRQAKEQNLCVRCLGSGRRVDIKNLEFCPNCGKAKTIQHHDF